MRMIDQAVITETRGAPEGARLPRRSGIERQIRDLMRCTAREVGQLLSIERNRLGSSQAELAAIIGCNQGDVSAIERGEDHQLSEAQVDRLLAQLGLSNAGVQASFLRWLGKNRGVL